MRSTLINTILCFFIVLLGITLSSSASIDNDDYAAANIDWMDFDTYYPGHQLEARAAKSRFWKRAPNRKFWKRSLVQSAMTNNDMIKSVSNEKKH
jgi:hypothetical protein